MQVEQRGKPRAGQKDRLNVAPLGWLNVSQKDWSRADYLLKGAQRNMPMVAKRIAQKGQPRAAHL